jgi:thiamine transport system ATP-binding protein
MLGVENVSVRFPGAAAPAVRDVTLSVGAGERLSVLGPSGSGKSTLLRAICGLEPLAAGRIEWDGEDLAGIAVHRRGFGLMFQDYVLFPHLNVARNVGFGLEMENASRHDITSRTNQVLGLVGLSGMEGRLPSELSGGEQQRVALARALAPRPRLLMLDEPLGALDRALRRSLLEEMSEVLRDLRLPIVYVTHDHEEALAIGDRVAVLRNGRIEAIAPPRELWLRPPTEFTARFLGFNNIFDASVEKGMADTPLGRFAVGGPEGQRRVLIRPDAFQPAADGRVAAKVRSAVFRGEYSLLRADVTGANPPQTLEIHADWSPMPSIGQEVRLSIDPAGVVALPLD